MSNDRKRKLDLGTDDAPPSKMKKSGESSAAAAPTVNPYTGRPFTKQYYDILEKRKVLPVWEQREEFFQLIRSNQVLILQGMFYLNE